MLLITAERRDSIQRILGKLESWALVNLMRFNKAKCKVLHLSQGNLRYVYKLGTELLESNPDEKDLEVPVEEELKMSQQCVLAAQMVSGIPGSLRTEMASRARIVPLYSTLMRPQLVYCTQVWGPQHRKDVKLLERLQRRAMKMIQGLENLSCEDKLKELGLFSLEKRKPWGDLIVVFQYSKGANKHERNQLFTRVDSDRTKEYGFKLKEGRVRLDIGEFLY